MSKIDLNMMSDEQYDILKELGNIGAGNATTALAKLINAKIDMKVPKVQLLDFTQLPLVMKSEEAIMVGILLQLEGDIEGMMMFLLEEDSARRLVNKVVSQFGGEPSEDATEFTEMEQSGLAEIGNIITGAYLSALSDLTRLTIIAGVPNMRIDMAAAILSIPAVEFARLGDKVLLIETKFDDESNLEGYFILIPELESYDIILSSLGM